MTFEEALIWLSGEGVSAAWGVVYSFLIEWWPALADRPPRVKRALALVGCLLIPVLAAIIRILIYPAGDPVEVIWQAVHAGLLAFFTNQTTHAVAFMRPRYRLVG
ncbi:MAG: hypothetical protein J7M34_06015 [Anaerolineae bacterium]|nr:hypothetical protein [Anaerolineae bacterium]